jgi:uncharacterized membrane-anchored protein
MLISALLLVAVIGVIWYILSRFYASHPAAAKHQRTSTIVLVVLLVLGLWFIFHGCGYRVC